MPRIVTDSGALVAKKLTMKKYLIVTSFNGYESNLCTTAELIEAQDIGWALALAQKKGNEMFADADDVLVNTTTNRIDFNYRDPEAELGDTDDILDVGAVWVREVGNTPIYCSVKTNILDLVVYAGLLTYTDALTEALESSKENGCEESIRIDEDKAYIDDGEYFWHFFELK